MKTYSGLTSVSAIATVLFIATMATAQASDIPRVWHRTTEIDGQTIFYREGGPT
ncbi:unnamed protein product, partial [marine sediment metagenome]